MAGSFLGVVLNLCEAEVSALLTLFDEFALWQSVADSFVRRISGIALRQSDGAPTHNSVT